MQYLRAGRVTTHRMSPLEWSAGILISTERGCMTPTINDAAIAVSDTEEQRLVERAQHDTGAFQQLYQHYVPRIYGYVSYRVGAVPDAEDLVAAIFLKVVEEIGRFRWRHDHSFAAWLFRIAHNHVSNFQRDSRAAGRALSLDAIPDIPASALLPLALVERQELFAQLYALIAELPPRRRAVITLKCFGGLRNREIAGVLGLDERTVASHLSRALADLHHKYQTRVAEHSEPTL